jgi:hypothetical protein
LIRASPSLFWSSPEIIVTEVAVHEQDGMREDDVRGGGKSQKIEVGSRSFRFVVAWI